MDRAAFVPYWLIERGSPAEWLAPGLGVDHWTQDSSKALKLTRYIAEEMVRLHYTDARATEHLDCAGPDVHSQDPSPAAYYPWGLDSVGKGHEIDPDQSAQRKENG